MVSRYMPHAHVDSDSAAAAHLSNATKFRGAIGMGAVALVIVNALFLENPPTWSALIFLLTAIIPFFMAARWLVSDVRRKPGKDGKLASTAASAKHAAKGALEGADKAFLGVFDELDQLLMTMYLFASTSPGHLVWIGCAIGLFASCIRALSTLEGKALKYRGAIGSLAILTIIGTTLIAHFGF
eukprot:Hpha_TRINITY_DN15444_c0_g1::TRINITY_DN15444_c0_g1_i2::g.176082::m.176082